MLKQYKAKMNDKKKPTTTCEWITVEDVSENKCAAESAEDFMQIDNLRAVMEYRCNLKLQQLAMKIGQRSMSKKEDFFDIWNDE